MSALSHPLAITSPLLLTHRIDWAPVAEPGAINPPRTSKLMSSFKPC
jgi:hypothetical protein